MWYIGKRVGQWDQWSRVKPGSDQWIFKLQKFRVHQGYPEIFPKLVLHKLSRDMTLTQFYITEFKMFKLSATISTPGDYSFYVSNELQFLPVDGSVVNLQ